MPVFDGALLTVTRGQKTMAWFRFVNFDFCFEAKENVVADNMILKIPKINPKRLIPADLLKRNNPSKKRNSINEIMLICAHASVVFRLISVFSHLE